MLRCPIFHAERFIREEFSSPDLVYVDADHSFRAVQQDIMMASRVAPTGIIAGDDWGWLSVRMAVLSSRKKLRARIFVSVDYDAWVFLRPHDRGQESFFPAGGWSRVRPWKVYAHALRIFRESF